MKRLPAIAVVIMLAALAYFLARPRETVSPPVVKIVEQRPAPPTATTTEPAEVFKRAFWRPPTANDKILHAERREWSDSGGVKKWQWFISVEPSPELLKYLRTDNAFGLVPVVAKDPAKDAPAWFAFNPSDVEVLGSRGNLRMIFSLKGKTLYATDSGGGFRPGAPEPAKRQPGPVSPGRLPSTPPPDPR